VGIIGPRTEEEDDEDEEGGEEALSEDHQPIMSVVLEASQCSLPGTTPCNRP